LNWYDSDVRNMMAHFNPEIRADKDFTNEERFFVNDDPEWADPADFAGDPIQVVWLSLLTILKLITALGIDQSFVTTQKIAALAEVHLFSDYPRITEGILTEAATALQNDYDVTEHLEEMRTARAYTFFGPSQES
jgi:hypothetical protein